MTEYDHTKHNLLEACGLSETDISIFRERWRMFGQRMEMHVTVKERNSNLVEDIERILDGLSPRLTAVLIWQVIDSAHKASSKISVLDGSSLPPELKELLEKISKKE